MSAGTALPAGIEAPKDFALPAMREDLQIVRGGASYSGAPIWIVLDPLRAKFFRITFEIFQLLSLWNASRSFGELARSLEARFGRATDAAEVGAVMRMLDARHFLAQPMAGSWKTLHDAAHGRRSLLMRLLHNYLFFKVPLVRPEPFLRATWPFVSFLFRRRFLLAVAAVGLAGLYLVSRQWESFLSTFPHVFTPEGAVVAALSIVLIKALHELGHAYTAHRHGCRVPTMGVAMMLMMPLLYTDVTDAWRLRSRRQRLRIDAAGIVVELCVAAIALFLWAFFPDGPLRSALFVLAATGWILSLAINLNPFMRFDGYYMFADLLGMENLQARAFQHMRWRLRRLLFGIEDEPAESFTPAMDAVVTTYAVLVTIYRIFLYLGIALLVYHFTVKLVGVALFAVEIGFFIVRPVYGELREWWGMRAEIRQNRRSFVSLGFLGIALLLFLMPLSTRIEAPAILEPERFARLFPAETGRIETVAVRVGQAVRRGDTLFVVAAPELGQELRLTAVEMALAGRRLARIGADADDLSERGLTETRLASLSAKNAGLIEREADLVVRAPFDGIVEEISPGIAPGRWVSRQEQLGYLSGGGGRVVRGFVAAADRTRLAVGGTGVFVPDDVTRPAVAVAVTDLAVSGLSEVTIPQLASKFGGKVAVHETADGRLTPADPAYAFTARVEAGAAIGQTASGVSLLEGRPESLASRVWRQVLRVLVREAGV